MADRSDEFVLGLDGCRAGWVAAKWAGNKVSYEILSTDEELTAAFRQAARVFIDIPIGLEDENYTRLADQALREELGKEYASSVFNAPIRPAAEAPNYATASMISFDFTEKKISMQAWNITPKIMQIDRILRKYPELQEKVFESHPELLFKVLNGGKVVEQKKSTNLGLKHRLQLLRGYMSNAKDLYREIKESENSRDAKEDDLLDAMALAVLARKSLENGLLTIPAEAPKDSQGLTMAIHYSSI